MTDDIELRLDCIRIASENLQVSTGLAMSPGVIEYADNLYRYITRTGSEVKKAA